MRNKAKSLTIAGLLQAMCIGLLLPTTAAANYHSCDSARSSCADSCESSKKWADINVGVEETGSEVMGEAYNASAARAENREEYRICLNNCDAQYNACESRRVQEDYDD